MGSHGIHELQARTLVVCPEQAPAVCVDVPHSLQSLEEGWPNVGILRTGVMRKHGVE